jgi:nucleoside 2-deoxyribosyltransferase
MMSKKVFVSYSRTDEEEYVKKVERILSEIGIEYFIDKTIPWGDSTTEWVEKKLTECWAVIFIVSPASLESQWVIYEIGYARGKGKKVLLE